MERFAPEQMAQMLFSLWVQRNETLVTLLKESWQNGKPKIAEAISIDKLAAELPQRVRSHTASQAGAKSRKKFRELANCVERFWMSDRCRFKSNEKWAEAAMLKKEFANFAIENSIKVEAEAVAQWPRKYRWNTEAKKKSVN